MKLGEYLKIENIFIGENYPDTDAFYADFSSFIKDKGIIKNNEKVKRLFIKRENVHSTAIGKGIAAPHIFSDEFSDFFITVALIREGMEYKSPDEQKVFLVFLIMSDERDIGLHLKTLAHIARLTKSTDISKLINTQTNAEELIKLIIDQESHI